MRRIVFLLLAVTCCLSITAQSKEETTTLFKYGKPLVACETNFENLFANFHKYVKADGLDFLSYKYVGELKNAKQARKLLKKNYSYGPLWAVGTSTRRENGKWESEIQLYPATESEFSLFDEMKKDAIETVSNEYARPGDKIYLLRFTYNLKTVEQYMFVHPDTKEVVTEGSIFELDVPLKHIEYCDKLAEKKGI